MVSKLLSLFRGKNDGYKPGTHYKRHAWQPARKMTVGELLTANLTAKRLAFSNW